MRFFWQWKRLALEQSERADRLAAKVVALESQIKHKDYALAKFARLRMMNEQAMKITPEQLIEIVEGVR